MRNPMNSWDKSDSEFNVDWIDDSKWPHEHGYSDVEIGQNDLALMKKLKAAGTDHRKFMRMIVVYVDITAPLYWWSEHNTYKVGTVANSCSTMHKIHAKEFTVDDFSHEHLMTGDDKDLDWGEIVPANVLEYIVAVLNSQRNKYLKTKNKKYWYSMIQLLPNSYNQKRTVMLNYEVLMNMYHSRKNHKLDEWREFCKWIESLPYFMDLNGDINGE